MAAVNLIYISIFYILKCEGWQKHVGTSGRRQIHHNEFLIWSHLVKIASVIIANTACDQIGLILKAHDEKTIQNASAPSNKMIEGNSITSTYMQNRPIVYLAPLY